MKSYTASSRPVYHFYKPKWWKSCLWQSSEDLPDNIGTSAPNPLAEHFKASALNCGLVLCSVSSTILLVKLALSVSTQALPAMMLVSRTANPGLCDMWLSLENIRRHGNLHLVCCLWLQLDCDRCNQLDSSNSCFWCTTLDSFIMQSSLTDSKTTQALQTLVQGHILDLFCDKQKFQTVYFCVHSSMKSLPIKDFMSSPDTACMGSSSSWLTARRCKKYPQLKSDC